MSTHRYIDASDIKANVAKGFELEEYIEEANDEVEDVAQQVGVYDPDDIEINPLHYKIKRYAVSFCIMRLCQDKIGTNNVDIAELDKYMIQYNLYKKEYEKLRTEITIEMVTGNINEIRDRASVSSGWIFRG